jgi:hypothetical protein
MNRARVGAMSAIVGAILLIVGTYLHPLGADPNDAVEAFTEYAVDHVWIASHPIGWCHIDGSCAVIPRSRIGACRRERVVAHCAWRSHRSMYAIHLKVES